MYRQYEDPRKLERELDRVRDEYEAFLASGGEDDDGYYAQRIAELEERVNFAWQDDEYDEMNRDIDDERWMEENVYSAEEVDDDYYFYRFLIGNGTAWLSTYVVETDHPITDYGALTDILIDYMVETGDNHILNFDEYEWVDDNGEAIYLNGDPDDIMYADEFVTGGNAEDVMVHYGSFDIEEITKDQITEDDIIIPDVW